MLQIKSVNKIIHVSVLLYQSVMHFIIKTSQEISIKYENSKRTPITFISICIPMRGKDLNLRQSFKLFLSAQGTFQLLQLIAATNITVVATESFSNNPYNQIQNLKVGYVA